MGRPRSVQDRAEQAYGLYLELGPDRSLRKLAEKFRSHFGEEPPTVRTLENWSSRYGWDRRAKQFDRDVAEQAHRDILRRHAHAAEEEIEVALDHVRLLHNIFREGMTREVHHVEAQDDMSIAEWDTREPIPPEDIPLSRGYFYLACERQAVMMARMLLGTAAADWQLYQEQQGVEGSRIEVLGPEAVREIGRKVGQIIRHLGRVTAEKRAERQLEVVDDEPAQPYPSADDPNLYWEEAPEDL